MIAGSLTQIPHCGASILAILLFTAVPTMSKRFDCPPLPTSCLCNYFGYLEIQCPTNDPNIIVRNEPGTYFDIECAKRNYTDYNSLPQMKIGDTQKVKIRRCPLPKGKSFDSILKHVGARGVRTLYFESYGTNLGTDLVRDHFLGLNELEHLILRENGLSDLPVNIFMDLVNLTWLDLQSNRINLHSDIFVNLSKLEFLELGNNNLQHLEPGMFRNQKRLKHLNLWGNNLQNLTMNSFEHASSIVDLDLSRNKLTSLKPNVFKLLTNLEDINLSGNNFAGLPEGLFTNNKKLIKIRLLYNLKRMETLPVGFLADLPRLAVVRIQADIKTLPEDMFMGSQNIENITLARNQLEVVPAGLFQNQTNLMNLDMSRNKLVDLPDNFFADTTSLVILDLSFNQLENISRDLFGNLRNLSILHLQNNNLVHIHSRAFVGTSSLQTIQVQNNRLLTESDAQLNSSPFQYLSKIKTLNLRNNSFDQISTDWISKLTHLQNLDLSYNKIKKLIISDVNFLATNLAVNLSHNNIREIDFPRIADATLDENIISVDLGENPLICDCHILRFVQFQHGSTATQIRNKLNIVSTDLRCAGPEELIGRPVQSLEYKELLCPLDSNSSSIEGCPSVCKCQVRLVDLTLIVNCSHSGLREVPRLPGESMFKTRFIELHVEQNNITKLPDRSHPGYNLVSKLYAKNNNIFQITAENIPTQLSVLDISNNSISWISASVFEAFNRTTNLTQVSLSNNPWQCDCDALPLLSFVRTNYNLIQDLNSMRCSSGARLSALSAEEMCQLHQIFITLSCIVAALGMLFGFMAALYYRFQAEIKAWLYAHNMCLWFVTEEEVDKDKKYDAFISYSNKDEDFIADQLLPNLENGPVKYKLCLHERDWVVGELIQNQIERSVEESRRTIIVLSPNFLESVWGRMEFQAAHKSALREGRARIIIIIYGEIGDTDKLDPEIKAYLKMNTYIKWDDPRFWNKLRYALPHPSSHGLSTSKEFANPTLKKSSDDKVELIMGSPATPPHLTTPPAEQADLKNLFLFKSNLSMTNSNPSIQPANGKISNGYINGGFIINTNPEEMNESY